MTQAQQPITHAQIEKAAQELAHTEDGKPAPFQAIINGVDLRRQVSREYQPEVDSAKKRLQAARGNATKKAINEAFDEQRDDIDTRYQQAIDTISAEIQEIEQLLSTQQSNYAAMQKDLKVVRRDNRGLREYAEKHKQSLEITRRNNSKVAQSLEERGQDVTSFSDSIDYMTQRIADVETELEKINKPENDLEQLLETIEGDIDRLQEQLGDKRLDKQVTQNEWQQKLNELRESIQQKRNDAVRQAHEELTLARDERNAAKAKARKAVTASVSREFAASGTFAAYRVDSGFETAARTTYGVGRGVAMIPVVVARSAADEFQKETKGQNNRLSLEEQRQQQQQQLSAKGGPQ